MIQTTEQIEKEYQVLPTMKLFHESTADIRCISGPVGSGKTSAAACEICAFIPEFLFAEYGLTKTRWVVVRNFYRELMDTTFRTIREWFPEGAYLSQQNIYILTALNPDRSFRWEVELLFRSCDRPEDVAKFKSLEITGYWCDESIEIKEETKLMLKNRIGRYPQKSPVRYGIETTNPPDIEHPTYHQFKWIVPPPAPLSENIPLADHEGFWQPPRENDANLPAGYYDRLLHDYKDYPDWIAMYIEGRPGIVQKGKLVYQKFNQEYHIAKEELIWTGATIYRGWDNSGNCPACIIGQIAPNGQLQILREVVSDIDNIVDFTGRVVLLCNQLYPGANCVDYGDPAGANKYSKREGGFTSNAQLMSEACGVNVISSDQNFSARVNAVESLLVRRDGILIDPSCVRLRNGFLGGYCYTEIGTSGIYRDAPEKNRFSHIHDALQYLCVKVIKSSPAHKGTGWQPVRRGRISDYQYLSSQFRRSR